MATVTQEDSLLHFICAKCNAHLTIASDGSGVKGPCPVCGEPITAPGKLSTDSSAVSLSSVDKVKKAVESKPTKPVVKPEAVKIADQLKADTDAPIHSKSGLTQEQEEQGEFSVVLNSLIFGLLFLLVAGCLLYSFKKEIFEWLNTNF